MKRRGNISLKLVADMCVKAGFDHLLTVDLHSKESQGFFSCRMDNLRASPFFLQYVTENIPDYQNAVFVARNPISARRATSFADRLKVTRAFHFIFTSTSKLKPMDKALPAVFFPCHLYCLFGIQEVFRCLSWYIAGILDFICSN